MVARGTPFVKQTSSIPGPLPAYRKLISPLTIAFFQDKFLGAKKGSSLSAHQADE
jgi:hypothetical protein